SSSASSNTSRSRRRAERAASAAPESSERSDEKPEERARDERKGEPGEHDEARFAEPPLFAHILRDSVSIRGSRPPVLLGGRTRIETVATMAIIAVLTVFPIRRIHRGGPRSVRLSSQNTQKRTETPERQTARSAVAAGKRDARIAGGKPPTNPT